MSGTNSIDNKTQSSLYVTETGNTSNVQSAGAGGTTPSDIDGVAPSLKSQYPLPSIAIGEKDIVAAYSSLMGKSEAIQSAMSMLVAHFGSTTLNLPGFTEGAMNSMLDRLFSVATTPGQYSCYDVTALRGSLDQMIQSIRESAEKSAIPLSPYEIKVLTTAQNAVDLLNSSATAEEIQKAIAMLLSHASGAGDTERSKALAGFCTLFASVLEAMNLTKGLETLLGKISDTQSLFRQLALLRDKAVEKAGIITSLALSSLVLVSRDQVALDLANRLSRMDAERRVREASENEEKLMDELAKKNDEKREDLRVEAANSSSTFNAALTRLTLGDIAGTISNIFAMVDKVVTELKQQGRSVKA